VHRGFAPYRGEFRYVFYTGDDLYDPTLDFYARVLDLPVVGGFGVRHQHGYSDGTYLAASVGVIEVIAGGGDDDLRPILTGAVEPYAPPRGGFLLIEVRDVDALAASVQRSGTRMLQALRDWPWLFRDFKVRDPCGNVVCCFSRLPGWEVLHGETAQ
jgi:catechol 2,3-dioxygenase-like lactoylglutathione lyase family enzyme